jgi:hypothetical protein
MNGFIDIYIFFSFKLINLRKNFCRAVGEISLGTNHNDTLKAQSTVFYQYELVLRWLEANCDILFFFVAHNQVF